jgi:hypothetical protein
LSGSFSRSLPLALLLSRNVGGDLLHGPIREPLRVGDVAVWWALSPTGGQVEKSSKSPHESTGDGYGYGY